MTRADYPLWVRLSIWGLSGRAAVLAFVWICVAAAVACCAYGFVSPRWFAGGGFLIGAWLYWAAVRWVDAHGDWAAK